MANQIADIYWEDVNGTNWYVDIYHATDSTSTIQFDNILSVTRNEDNADNGVPFGVCSQSWDLSILVENATQEALIPIIVSSYENDIYAEIYQGSTLKFRGFLLQDTVERENRNYPFALNLTFTDSLKKASEVDFSSTTAGNWDVIQLLKQCLTDLEVVDIYAATDDILRTSIGYDENAYAIGVDDPYSYIHFNVLGFYDDANSDNPKRPKVGKILDELCRCFNSRLYYADNMYHFESLDVRVNSTYDYWTYKQPFTVTKNTGVANPKLTIDQSVHKILEGGTITYLPPIKQAVCTYDTETNNFLAGFLWDSENYSTIQDICYVVDNSGNYLRFKFTYRYVVNIGAYTGTKLYVRFRAKIKVGSYYYVRGYDEAYGEGTWQTGEDWYYWTHTIEGPNYILSKAHTIESLIETKDLPASGTLSLLIESVGATSEGWDVADSYFSDYSFTSLANTINQMAIVDEDGEAVTGLKYYAENDSNNAKELSYNGIMLDYAAHSIYAILWDAGTPEQTDGWDVIGESPAVTKDIQEQMLRSVCHLRQTTRMQHSMTVKHTSNYYHSMYLITYDSDDYMILRHEFDAIKALSNLDLFQFEKGTNEPTITNDEIKDYEAVEVGLTTETVVTPNNDDSDKDGLILTTQLLSSGSPVISVTINGMIGDYFEGDTMKIYSPAAKQPLPITLSANCFDGWTSLNFLSVTPTIDYPIDSVVIPDPRKSFKSQTFTGVNDAYVIPTITTLPDETVLSESAMRRKVVVYHQDIKMNYVHGGLTAARDNYNDFSVEKSTGKIHFQEALVDGRIFVEIEN